MLAAAIVVLACGFGTCAVAKTVGVAVLDFETTGATRPVDNWAYGLADFLDDRLGRKGVGTFERRHIRYVLAERGLESTGLSERDPALRRALPSVDFLVGGRIAVVDAEHFELSVSMASTHSGVERARLRERGRYPEDLAAALDRVAQALCEKLSAPIDLVSPRLALPGFTSVPEVALLFYKGLDHQVRGRPEFAAEYFRQAYASDPGFGLALVWRGRALEALGLVELAASVRSRFLAGAEGLALFGALAPSLAHVSRELVVMLTPAASGSVAHGPELAAALASHPRLRVFTSQWIDALAAEMDLRLSGSFENSGLERAPWFAADALIRVESGADGDVSLEWLDALSGLRLARTTGRAATMVDAQRLINDLVAALGQEVADGALPYRRAPLDYTLPDHDLARYSRQAYAYLLRAHAERPDDRVVRLQHAQMHLLHSVGEHQPGTYDYDWPYVEILWRQALQGIDAAEANAANWLSHLLWRLRPTGHRARTRVLPSLAQHFAPLLERHPQSFAASCVRYIIAMEQVAAGDSREALASLRALAPGFAQPEPDGLALDFENIANLHYWIARLAQQTGQPDLARTHAGLAAQAAERHAHYRTRENLATQRRVSHVALPVRPVLPMVAYQVPGRGGHREGYFWVASMTVGLREAGRVVFRVGQSINGEIMALAQSTAADAPEEASGSSIEDLYRRSVKAKGAAGVGARMAYLEGLIREIERDRPLDWSYYHGNLKHDTLPFLAVHTRGASRLGFESRLRELVTLLLSKRGPYYINDVLAMDLYESAGMSRALNTLATAGLDSPFPPRRRGAILGVARAMLTDASAAEAGRFILSEIQRWEEELALYGMDYLDLVHAAANAFREAGELDAAAKVYREALRARLFIGLQAEEDEARARMHQQSSLRFWLALVERDRGDHEAAARLLRKVAEASESHPDWMLHRNGHQSTTHRKKKLYEASLLELSELRVGTANVNAGG